MNSYIPELMTYAAIGYLLIGAYLTFLGGFKGFIDNEIETTIKFNQDEFNSNSTLKTKLYIARILFSMLTTLLWPFFLSSINPSRAYNRSPKARALRFDAINGHGIFFCMACRHSEKITAFTHGLFDHEDGTQCQSCGSFHAVSSKSEMTHCKCGGLLSREHTIFCPKCRSGNVAYTPEYMN